MLSLRLIADDLTGALDSAAAFAAPGAAVPVVWQVHRVPAAGSVAFDTGTREQDAAIARDTVASASAAVLSLPGALRFKKLDSLLRGSQADEIAAVLAAGGIRRCVIAPAFPAQGRVTRGGRQGVLGGDGRFEPLRIDLAADLRARGQAVRIVHELGEAADDVSVWDAESDRDLDAVVAANRDDGVLWVGSAGLAAALARAGGIAAPDRPARVRGPLLALLGTNHPVTLEQLGAVAEHRLPAASARDADAIGQRLRRTGCAFVTASLPPGTARTEAAARIDATFGDLVRRLDPPGSLFVSGGETLRALCAALDAEALLVTGEFRPGVPRSILTGGRWDGVEVISKSGAFGTPDHFRTLLAATASPSLGA